MTLLLVESAPDPASVGIAGALRGLVEWRPLGAQIESEEVLAAQAPHRGWLVRTPRLHLHAEAVEAGLQAAGIRPECLVFLSKHAAKSGQASLTVHPVGNWTEARYGGQPGRLTPTLGPWQSEALRRLERRRRAHAYPASVTFEVTHHGPFLSTPAFFVELGSAEPQWNDATGHRVVAEAVADLLAAAPAEAPTVVGLGGGHYAPRHTEAALTKRVHFAHLVPTHAAEAVPDVPALAAEVARASPGARGYYVHRGTLPGPVEERWAAALEAEGLRRVESRAWAASDENFMRTP